MSHEHDESPVATWMVVAAVVVLLVLVLGGGAAFLTHRRATQARVAASRLEASREGAVMAVVWMQMGQLAAIPGLGTGQKARLAAELGRLRPRIEAGELDLAAIESGRERIVETQVTPALGVLHCERLLQMVDVLSPDEKAAATLALSRLRRGLVQQKLDQRVALEALAPAGMSWEGKVLAEAERADWLEVTERARRAADEAEVPDEPFVLDVVSALRTELGLEVQVER